jgi:hypothetical protein
MIKPPKKLGIEGTYLNIIKAIYEKSIANTVLNGKKLEAFLLESRARQGCPLSPLLLNSNQNLGTGIKPRERNKRIQDEVKLSLFVDDMILYLQVPKDSIRKHLRIDKCFQQNSNVQNQYTKICGLGKPTMNILWKKPRKLLSLHIVNISNSQQPQKIPRNNLIKGGERPP